MLLLFIATCLAQLPEAWDSGAVYSTQVYLSPSGADATGTGSQGAPYASLSRALQGAQPGTDIIMLPGTYGPQGFLSGISGSLAAPIRIRGEGQVFIDGNGGSMGFHLSKVNYIVLQGFTVRNTGDNHGINIDDGGDDTPSNYLVVRDVTIVNAGNGSNRDCLKASGVDNFFITGVDFSDCNRGECIDFVGCHDGVVTDSFFHDTPGTALQLKGGSARITISRNRFSDVAIHAINLGGATGLPYFRPLNATFEASQLHAVGNLILGSPTNQAAVAFIGCVDCTVRHNTLIDIPRWVWRILPGLASKDPSSGGIVENNIIRYNAGSLRARLNVGGGQDSASFAFRNNLWYSTSGGTWDGSYPGTGAPAEMNLLTSNPEFVGATDFHITAASPAAGSGAVVTPAAYDFDGNPFSATAPSRGAFRAPGGASSTSAPTTRAPTTRAPTTRAPTTRAPTTSAQGATSSPTTIAPTTSAQGATGSPTTIAPTTTSSQGSTGAPTTGAPTTLAPTSGAGKLMAFTCALLLVLV